MPNVVEQWLDRKLNQLGYRKADDTARGVVTTFYEGFTPLGQSAHTALGQFGHEELENLAITSAWVYSDITTIGDEMSAATFHVMTRQGEELTPVIDHEFERIFNRPNEFMSGEFMLKYLMWWLGLRGEAYLLQVTDSVGGLVELWPIPADIIAPIPDRNKYISGYAYQLKTGQSVTFPVESVCFMRYPNPRNYHRGLAPMSAYRMSVLTDYEASKYNHATFVKGGVIPTIIGLPKEMSRPQFEQAIADIKQRLESDTRYVVARTGDISVDHIAVAQKDLEFLAGREFTRDEIDRVFHIPSGYWNRDATRANAEGAKATMIEQAVWPNLTLIAGEMTAQILKRAYGVEYVGQFEDIRPRNVELELSQYSTYEQDSTINENRERQGLDPVDYEGLANVPIRILPLIQSGIIPPPGGMPPTTPPLAEEPEEDDTEAKADLERWQSIELRRLKRGEGPGYAFQSEHIPGHIIDHVKAHLQDAHTAEEVRAAFAAGFRQEARVYP